MKTFRAINADDMHDWILMLDPFGYTEGFAPTLWARALYQTARDKVLDGDHPTTYRALETAIDLCAASMERYHRDV